MSAAVATVTEAPRRSLLAEMAGRYGMEPAAFAATLKATVVPANTSNEEFAAFLVVAREYDLNPLTKEIYAFPKRGGGIQPIVPIDGWTNIINSNPALDGIEFEDHHDDQGKLTAITCRLWRKDRSKPVMVTEYMSECFRQTDTWKTWPHRMLRHKALIQCARYAFGLAGIVDPDEAERAGAEGPMRDVTPQPPAPPPPPPPPPAEPETAEASPPPPPPPVEPEQPKTTRRQRQHQAAAERAEGIPDAATDPDAFLGWIEKRLAAVEIAEALETVWNDDIEPRLEDLFPPMREDAMAIYQKHERRLGGE